MTAQLPSHPETSPDASMATTGDAAGTPPTCCGRRHALQAAGLVAVAGTIGACGSSDSGDSNSADSGPSQGSGSGSSASSGSGGGATAKTADVAVGGGVILKDAKAVITQPSAGEYKAFSSVCTHEGCAVTSVENSKIICNCHGSEFDASTGEATKGPAEDPLTSKKVTVSGDTITVA